MMELAIYEESIIDANIPLLFYVFIWNIIYYYWACIMGLA